MRNKNLHFGAREQAAAKLLLSDLLPEVWGAGRPVHGTDTVEEGLGSGRLPQAPVQQAELVCGRLGGVGRLKGILRNKALLCQAERALQGWSGDRGEKQKAWSR